jgi:hypothetical protein
MPISNCQDINRSTSTTTESTHQPAIEKPAVPIGVNTDSMLSAQMPAHTVPEVEAIAEVQTETESNGLPEEEFRMKTFSCKLSHTFHTCMHVAQCAANETKHRFPCPDCNPAYYLKTPHDVRISPHLLSMDGCNYKTVLLCAECMSYHACPFCESGHRFRPQRRGIGRHREGYQRD